MGAISDKNTRTLITIPKDLKEKLHEMAEAENRSFNNLVITVLSNYVKTNYVKTNSTSLEGNEK